MTTENRISNCFDSSNQQLFEEAIATRARLEQCSESEKLRLLLKLSELLIKIFYDAKRDRNKSEQRQAEVRV